MTIGPRCALKGSHWIVSFKKYLQKTRNSKILLLIEETKEQPRDYIPSFDSFSSRNKFQEINQTKLHFNSTTPEFGNSTHPHRTPRDSSSYSIRKMKPFSTSTPQDEYVPSTLEIDISSSAVEQTPSGTKTTNAPQSILTMRNDQKPKGDSARKVTFSCIVETNDSSIENNCSDTNERKKNKIDNGKNDIGKNCGENQHIFTKKDLCEDKEKRKEFIDAKNECKNQMTENTEEISDDVNDKEGENRRKMEILEENGKQFKRICGNVDGVSNMGKETELINKVEHETLKVEFKEEKEQKDAKHELKNEATEVPTNLDINKEGSSKCNKNGSSEDDKKVSSGDDKKVSSGDDKKVSLGDDKEGSLEDTKEDNLEDTKEDSLEDPKEDSLEDTKKGSLEDTKEDSSEKEEKQEPDSQYEKDEQNCNSDDVSAGSSSPFTFYSGEESDLDTKEPENAFFGLSEDRFRYSSYTGPKLRKALHQTDEYIQKLSMSSNKFSAGQESRKTSKLSVQNETNNNPENEQGHIVNESQINNLQESNKDDLQYSSHDDDSDDNDDDDDDVDHDDDNGQDNDDNNKTNANFLDLDDSSEDKLFSETENSNECNTEQEWSTKIKSALSYSWSKAKNLVMQPWGTKRNNVDDDDDDDENSEICKKRMKMSYSCSCSDPKSHSSLPVQWKCRQRPVRTTEYYNIGKRRPLSRMMKK